MDNVIAKIIGDNLDSNDSMVLFADKTVTLTAESETFFRGVVELQLFDTQEEAQKVRDELCDYLEHCSKSRVILFNPLVDASVIGLESTVRIPILYAIVDSSIELVSVNNGAILISKYVVDVAQSAVDVTKWSINLLAITQVVGTL